MTITKGCALGAKMMFGALFFAVEITCQEQAAILKPLGNQTVVLGEQAHFFCQLLGREDDLRLRINGRLHALPFITPDLVIGVQSSAPRMDGLSVSNISIDITATRERNLTLIECYDATMNSAAFSSGTLTVRGGPGEPEVGYEVNRDGKEIVLSWPHPFTWEDYPITGYDIVCRETESEKIIHDMTLNDTDILNEPVVNHTVDLPPCVPDCYTLQCTVTAFNSLWHCVLPFYFDFSFRSLKTT
ncbi:hypothetical protein GBAR_LOCUS14784 [Geodia barretti]|uniref:Uncharacterized protein n=1 Tax=Geodia barretti TaxID=519541 RepID=A0AA35SAG5_GEOBA|nr:hypothetical protein GBAR_LOCUS14784 [Geodia barretti]